jgi:hypothetical protein
MTARAIATETRNAEIEANTITMEEARQDLRAEHDAIRAAFKKVPRRIVKAVPPGATREEVERIAADAINDALIELRDDAERILAEAS